MADELVRYAKRHGKLIATAIGCVFVMGGMFYTARADMETIKKSNQQHSERLKSLESDAASSYTKLDAIAEDVKIIKEHIIGGE